MLSNRFFSLLTSSLCLSLSFCLESSPVSAENQEPEPLSFAEYIEQEDRLLELSFPLLQAGTSYTEERSWDFGFVLHDLD